MRTRGRIIAQDVNLMGPYVSNRYAYPSGSLISSSSGLASTHGATVDQFYEDETMVDDPVNRPGRPMKSVSHIKYLIERVRLDYTEYVAGSDRYTLSGNNAHWEAWGKYGSDITPRNLRFVWSKDERTLLRETTAAFYKLNEVDSLLNTIESPQLVTYARSLYGLVQTGLKTIANPRKVLQGIANNSSASSRSLRAHVGRVARNSIRTATGIHLGYAFGVAPLVSDMRKLSKATLKYKERLKKATATAGTEVSVHRFVQGNVSDVLHPDTVSGLYPGYYGSVQDTGSSWWHAHVSGSAIRTCTVKGRRTVRYTQDVFSRLDNLIYRFGVTGPASFAWERIPFSFVLDWFVDLSVVLGVVDNALTGSTKNITGACISEKLDVDVDVIHHRVSPTFFSIYDGKLTARVRLSSYTRKPTSADIQIGLSGRFGKKQAFLTGSLIGQMAANLKTKR